MGSSPMQEFKRLFYKLYFADMRTEEVLELALAIDVLAGQMLGKAEATKKVKQLDAELKVFGEELLDLIRDA